MRKSLIGFTVLAVASVLFLFCGAAAINEGGDDITVTEVTLAGDPAEAAGLHTTVVLNEDRRLYWTTDYDVSADPQPETVFAYYQTRRRQSGGEYQKDAHLSLGSVGFGMSGHIDLEQELAYMHQSRHGNTMLLLPVIDLASRVGAGETATEILNLRDYYEYYPVYLECGWAGMENFDEVRLAHWDLYQEYFRIPVTGYDKIEVSVTKDEEGRVVDVSCNTYYPEEKPEEAADVYTYTASVVTDDAVYLVLHGTHDYSQIKGGYGVYRIPIEYYDSYGDRSFSEPQASVEIGKIENIYPLDLERSEDYRLYEGVTENELLLFEQRGDHVTVLVMDTATYQVRQEIDLDTEIIPEVWYHENLVIMGTTDYGKPHGRLQILLCEDGAYDLWLDTDFYPLNDEGYFYYEPVFCFDGARFAMAAFHEVYNTASHRITVYDKTGLIYAGDYHMNSDELTQPLRNYNWDGPLRLNWK